MKKFAVLVCSILVFAGAINVAAQQKFTAHLNGAQHVPQVNTSAKGSAVVSLNAAENQITVTLSYSGLSAPAFAAHIHGAAALGQNAPVLFNFLGVDSTTETVTGTFAVTLKEISALRANRLYFNVHTPNFPNGEIRGQIKSINIKDDIDGDGRSDLNTLRLAPPEANITEAYTLNSLDKSFAARQIPFVVDQSVFGDFNLDGRNDLDAIRIDPPTGNYQHYFYDLSSGLFYSNFGLPLFWGNNNAGDLPVGGDFDADGIPDTVVFRKTDGSWFVRQSSDGQLRAEQFGAPQDIPAASDYDKDGRTDLAVVRNVGGQLTWFIRRSSDNGLRVINFGLAASDTILNKAFWVDFDGDGAADPALVRKIGDDRIIYALRSSDGTLYAVQWGLRLDRTAIVDADGDGRSDVVAVRTVPEFAGQLIWYIWESSRNGLTIVRFGLGTDAIVAVD